MALAALFVGAGGGAVFSAFLHTLFANWHVWIVAVPGGVWALLVALAAFWGSMDSRRRFLVLGPRTPPRSGRPQSAVPAPAGGAC